MKCAYNKRAHLQSTYRSGAERLVAGGGEGGCTDGIDAEVKGTEVSGLKDPSQQRDHGPHVLSSASPCTSSPFKACVCSKIPAQRHCACSRGKITRRSLGCVIHISPHDCSCVPAKRSEPP